MASPRCSRWQGPPHGQPRPDWSALSKVQNASIPTAETVLCQRNKLGRHIPQIPNARPAKESHLAI